MNEDYLQEKYMQKVRWYHFAFGLKQIGLHPALILLFVPIIVLTVGYWLNIEYLISFVNEPQLFLWFWSIAVKCCGVLIPALAIAGLIEAIGIIVSNSDERNILKAFDKKDRRLRRSLVFYTTASS